MRLIDADALRAEFKGDDRGLYHYTGIWAAIDAAPTIDAVPVVRCKDCCIYSPLATSNGHCWRTNTIQHPDDFCSHAKECKVKE